LSLDSHRPIYLAGPTGCGKSAVAVELAERIGGEIVNADAFQIYQELRILTARPSESDEARVPHHLYGVVPAAENCAAARFAEIAQPVIEEITNRSVIPIVVSGSGLYLKALTHGLDDAPASDPEIRAELDQLDLEQLLARLIELDPASAERIDSKNRRYVQRAVEISLISGRPASAAREAWKTDDPGLRGALLTRERENLYERINERTAEMLENGAIEEVAAVEAWSETSEKAIGAREIRSHLKGEIDLETCVTQIQQSTRRFAKRQMTWFQRERWLTKQAIEQNPASVADQLAAKFSAE
jgi:tRNA dimethylallyltransferase